MSELVSLPFDNLPFAWDRTESAGTLRAKLDDITSSAWVRTAAWLMREAQVREVWQFLTLEQIDTQFESLRPLLGKRQQLWDYLLRTARELGKL